jgi:hypothetical protein
MWRRTSLRIRNKVSRYRSSYGATSLRTAARSPIANLGFYFRIIDYSSDEECGSSSALRYFACTGVLWCKTSCQRPSRRTP